MPRTARKAPPGVVFHVLNRGVGRERIFHKDEDFVAFERVMAHAHLAEPLELFAYCLMPNHWHLLLRPTKAGQLGRFMQRLTMTHTRRWQEHYHRVGDGHLYQGRFKSFPVQDDAHFLTVARYVERNALRAKLTKRAEDWPWSSLWRRVHDADPSRPPIALAAWRIRRPTDWLERVNAPQTDAEVMALRTAIAKSRPVGDDAWTRSTVKRLGLQSSLRDVGRPSKRKKA